MVSLTAIIRCKPGTADAVLEALVAVGAHVEANEPDTLAYVVTRSSADPSVLLTHERFKDTAAMEAHNAGAASQAFFAASKDFLDDVVIHVGDVVLAVSA